MTKYEYLLSKKENGELSMLFELGLPVHLSSWMEIYEYHLEHPQKSQWQVSLVFRVSKGTVWNAYRFLFDFASKVEQSPTILWSLMSKKQRSLRANILDFLTNYIKKVTKKIFFLAKNLHLSKICSNFAANLERCMQKYPSKMV